MRSILTLEHFHRGVEGDGITEGLRLIIVHFIIDGINVFTVEAIVLKQHKIYCHKAEKNSCRSKHKIIHEKNSDGD